MIFKNSRAEMGVLRVSSSDREVEVALEKALRGTEHISFATIESLRASTTETRINVLYEGRRVSFNFAYTGTLASDFIGQDIYSTTNERYTHSTALALEGVAGVTHYLGIAGGLDQVLAQLHILWEINEFSRISVIDINPKQQFNNTVKLLEYDSKKGPGHQEGFGAVDDIAATLKGWRVTPEHININLSVSSMIDAIRGIDEPGTYFIYLSNAYPLPIFMQGDSWVGKSPSTIGGWASLNSTAELLKEVAANRFISNDSFIMFSSAYSDKAVLLMKDGKRVVPLAFAGYLTPDETGQLARVELENYVNRREQQKFLDSMLDGDVLFRSLLREREGIPI